MEKLSDVRLRVSELEKYGKDRDRFLSFLYDLERMGLIRSELVITNKTNTERVWYPITEKEKT